MNAVLKTPLGWKPRFMPQVTVQHSLSYTIPLVASLFGNKNTTHPPKIIAALTLALPLLSKKNDLIENNNYFTEENGLIFLHALTCASMQRSQSESLNDLFNSLYTTVQNFQDFKQADPKVSLSFLSRRPISMIWAEVKKAKNIDSSFEQLYTDRILKGNSLFAKLVVPHFKFVNYAEEYYFGNNHERRDLSCLKDSFGKLAILSQEKSDDPLSFLLEHGIMSTVMARYLFPNIAPTVKQVTDYWFLKQLFPSDTVKKCISFQCRSNVFTFDDYLGECIRTVDNPSHTYEFDPQTMSIKKVETNVDSLSPPWLIEQPNSMGYYRYTEDFDTGYTFDESYGEAILEIRSIKDISKDAITAMGMNYLDVFGTFLNGQERTLLSDMKSLLCILNKHFILTNGIEIIKNINIKRNI
jgi:hypothetical protein